MRRCVMRKGQTLVIEQVLLFAIGVAIFTISFAVFSSYQAFYRTTSTNDIATGVRDLVASNVLKVAGQDNTTASFLILPLPRTIGEDPYFIQLNQTGLTIDAGNGPLRLIKSPTLYGLNASFVLQGRVWSVNGRITIKRDRNKIILT